MNWRPILFSLCAVFAGCGDGGSSTKNDSTPETGEALKVTWLRYYYNSQTKKFEPGYYVMISNSWSIKYGEDPREPLARLFPRKSARAPSLGTVPDWELKQLVQKMESLGLSRLKWVKP